MKTLPDARTGRRLCGQEDYLLAGKHVTSALDLVDTRDGHAYGHTQWARGNFTDLVQYVTQRGNKNSSASSKTFMPFQHAMFSDNLGSTGVFFSRKSLIHPTVINMLFNVEHLVETFLLVSNAAMEESPLCASGCVFKSDIRVYVRYDVQ